MQKHRSRRNVRRKQGWRQAIDRALGPVAERLRRGPRLAPAPAESVKPAPERVRAVAPVIPGRRIAVALQGGGVHGAFTWGVLDRMLAEGQVEFEAASGASAGALNAVVLASGLAEGGPEQARLRLRELWEGVAAIGNLSPFRPAALDPLATAWNSDWAPGTFALEFLTRMLSPYQLNPFAINPLRQLVERIVDFERLRASPFKLFVSATNLRTGRARVFTTPDITADTILASACLPSLNQAVEIDGEHYWDGGFTANPPVLPLVSGCESPEILVVRITPTREADVPMTARDIQGRIHRIVFNASLHREIETIAWMRDAVGAESSGGGPLAERLRSVRIHHIDGDETFRPLGTASALHADWSLISHLFGEGDARAAAWLSGDAAQGGEIPTVAAIPA
jgi:NTE family protein